LIKGGVIESKSEDPKEETPLEKRELVIDDLNLDIGGDTEENKQSLGTEAKSRN